ncbi:hypothetical protein CUU65_07765 [Bacillus safensis]|uniref:hypothetical protein n=1 Tax=Bacillus safensis TaxID=561879 RepID=UPI000C77691B|nr:hypothetical protein [Bacillus safensis]PLT38322.1 hypothetical protein CUU65_07765 [Bacillus safensis]
MKNFNKILLTVLTAILMFSIFSPNMAEAASSAHVDLGGGWDARIDRPHDTKTGKWHGHVYDNKGKQIGAENVDGTKHDGKDFKKVPKKKLEKLKKSKKWKDAKSKNKKLVDSRSEMSWVKFLAWLASNLVLLNI